MRRFIAFLLLPTVLLGCMTAWERHTKHLNDALANQEIDDAVNEQQWLIENASSEAPVPQRGKEAEFNRQVRLADLYMLQGNADAAVEELRTALQTDPARHEEVRRRLAQLPLTPAERRRVTEEFHWNLNALHPETVGTAEGAADAPPECWSYRAREIHVRRTEVRQGLEGGERWISYDVRPWIYDERKRAWQAEGSWVDDMGAETERISGPSRPRYRAITAADGGFFTEGPVPPCHRKRWTGPFDPGRDRLFVAQRLPTDEP